MKTSTKNYLLYGGLAYAAYYVGRQGTLGQGVQDAMLGLHKTFMGLFGVQVDVAPYAAPSQTFDDANTPLTGAPANASIIVNDNTGPFWAPYQQSLGTPGFIGAGVGGGIEGDTGI